MSVSLSRPCRCAARQHGAEPRSGIVLPAGPVRPHACTMAIGALQQASCTSPPMTANGTMPKKESAE